MSSPRPCQRPGVLLAARVGRDLGAEEDLVLVPADHGYATIGMRVHSDRPGSRAKGLLLDVAVGLAPIVVLVVPAAHPPLAPGSLGQRGGGNGDQAEQTEG